MSNLDPFQRTRQRQRGFRDLFQSRLTSAQPQPVTQPSTFTAQRQPAPAPQPTAPPPPPPPTSFSTAGVAAPAAAPSGGQFDTSFGNLDELGNIQTIRQAAAAKYGGNPRRNSTGIALEFTNLDKWELQDLIAVRDWMQAHNMAASFIQPFSFEINSRPESVPGFEPEPEIPDTTQETPEETVARVRGQLQPIFDQLAQMTGNLPEFPDIASRQQGIQDLIDQIQSGDIFSQEEVNESFAEAARAGGFFDIDASGNVIPDVQGFLDAQRRSIAGAPRPSDISTTPEQERQIRATRRAMQESAAEMVNNIVADSGSVARAMQASRDLTVQMQDRELQARRDTIAQNFANELLAFQAEQEPLLQAINRGTVARNEFLARRERQVDTALDSLFVQTQQDLSLFQGEQQAILAQTQILLNSANAIMGVEEGLFNLWNAAFAQEIAPRLAALEQQLTEATIGDIDFQQDLALRQLAISEGATAAANTSNVLIGILGTVATILGGDFGGGLVDNLFNQGQTA